MVVSILKQKLGLEPLIVLKCPNFLEVLEVERLRLLLNFRDQICLSPF